jgi:phosphatidylserine/phosphatidylglycerophosphate/cardiolipin synthase-like enzyme
MANLSRVRLASAAPDLPRRAVTLALVRDGEHHAEIVERGVRQARASVWIATANLKDVHVEARVGTRARAARAFTSLFDELAEAARRGVEVRILYSGRPSRPLAARVRRRSPVGMRCCPRSHLKMIAVDGRLLYLGSANFTGAGLGAKGAHRRNFEAGIVTDDDWLLDEMQASFDRIWQGGHCIGCRLRSACPEPLDRLGAR